MGEVVVLLPLKEWRRVEDIGTNSRVGCPWHLLGTVNCSTELVHGQANSFEGENGPGGQRPGRQQRWDFKLEMVGTTQGWVDTCHLFPRDRGWRVVGWIEWETQTEKVQKTSW